jgi:hypothetical protein
MFSIRMSFLTSTATNGEELDWSDGSPVQPDIGLLNGTTPLHSGGYSLSLFYACREISGLRNFEFPRTFAEFLLHSVGR